MTYEEFLSELLKKLESKVGELGYHKVRFYPDGFTSDEMEDLVTIRSTNIRYNKMESDMLSGDYVILDVESKHSQMCRFSCRDLYEMYGENAWEAVWTEINESVALCKKNDELSIMELLDRNEYEALRDKIFIRLLNYNDHRYELKDNVYKRFGDIVLVLYLLASDEHNGERHDVTSIKVPRAVIQSWGLSEDAIWENAMNSTYIMSPPRMYLDPMDTYHPPYHKGAFMALNSDIKSLAARAVPTVTTTTQMNGAVALFYPGVKERIAQLFGGDFYVAFTSIHEGRIHKRGILSPRQILDHLKQVNKTFDPTEILSRKVYLYESDTNVFKQLEL